MSFFIRKRGGGGGGGGTHSSSGLPTKLSESVGGGKRGTAVGGGGRGRGGGSRGRGRGVKRTWDRGSGGGGRGRRKFPERRRGDDDDNSGGGGRGGGKRPKTKGGDEEITSEEEEDDDVQENGVGGTLTSRDREMSPPGSEEEENDDDDGGDANETEQEARIRLAKEQIQMLRRRLENEKKSRRGDDDDDEEENDESATTDGIAKLLKTQVMEEQGKVLRNVLPKDFEGRSLSVQVIAKGGKALKSPLTSIITTPDSVFTATKSGDIARYSLEDGTRTAHVTLKKSTVTSLALTGSSSTSLLLCVSTPSAIHLLDATTLATTQKLSNSRNSVSVAASGTSLFSTHKDRTVKVWDTGERAFVEALFGHQDVPTAVDVVPGEGDGAGGNERRIVTAGGFDRSLRVWKLDSESQLLFTWDEDVIDVVRVLSGGYFVAGGISGSLGLFSFGRKRPLHVVKEAHGTQTQPTHDCDYLQQSDDNHLLINNNNPKVPRWITAVGGLGNLVASGSDDGTVKVWRVVARKLEHVRDISVGDGVVVAISVIMGTTADQIQDDNTPSSSSPTLVIGVSTEMRLGRWGGRTGKCSRVVVVK